MNTNFALSLSLAGIDLLQRVDSGWRRVGTASLLSTGIAEELADLRAKGQALAPDGLRTKLVIPMEQIKYLTIDTTQTTLSDIHTALDGATPYALDELAIDFERFGGRTHIAAVARETLKEAEDFAHAHGFNPVCFVAVPDPFTFKQEIFFGPTSVAAGILGQGVVVNRDALPVMLVGTRIKSRLLVLDQTNDNAPAFNPVAAPVDAPESVAKALIAAVQTLPEPVLLDRIIAEYHAPKVSETVQPAAMRAVLGTAIPVAPAHLDPIIAEHHRISEQVEVPLVAVAVAGSSKPVVLGGVMAAAPKAANAAPRRSFAVPGAIAAGVAALSFFVWSQYSPAVSVAEVSPAIATLSPDAGLVDIAIAAPAQSLTDNRLPDDDTAVTSVAPPTPLVSDPADTALADVQVTPDDAAAVVSGRMLSPDEAAAAYAATGVWQRVPRFVDLPPAIEADNVIWPVAALSPDRMALPVLPSVDALTSDHSFVAPVNPPAADVVFDLDDDGFVRATAEGAVTVDGAVVYAGLPDLPFRERPQSPGDEAAAAIIELALTLDEEEGSATDAEVAEASQNDEADDLALASANDDVTIIAGRPPVVPPLRPEIADLTQDETEGSEQEPTAGGVSLAGLQTGAGQTGQAVIDLSPPSGAIRPRVRPALPGTATSSDEVTAVLGGIAFAQPDPLAGASELAVASSLRPATRPNNFDRVVASAQSRQQPAPPPDPEPAPAAPAAAPAPAAPQPQAAPPAPAQVAAPVAPQNYAPVPGGVARAATQENAIRLRDINLIGVYGQANARRALVRLSNGQYVRVQVGSELDGGQVTAIGENALNYVKRGTTYALQIPSG